VVTTSARNAKFVLDQANASEWPWAPTALLVAVMNPGTDESTKKVLILGVFLADPLAVANWLYYGIHEGVFMDTYLDYPSVVKHTESIGMVMHGWAIPNTDEARRILADLPEGFGPQDVPGATPSRTVLMVDGTGSAVTFLNENEGEHGPYELTDDVAIDGMVVDTVRVLSEAFAAAKNTQPTGRTE
jgi:hypothetical protein